VSNYKYIINSAYIYKTLSNSKFKGGKPMTEPNVNTQTPQVETFDPQDIEKNKVMAALAYILFFLPLIVCPDSKFGRFHANQGLLLLIVAFAGSFILTITIVGLFLVPFYSIAIFVFAIIGFINGLNGKAKELPLFGKFRIIK